MEYRPIDFVLATGGVLFGWFIVRDVRRVDIPGGLSAFLRFAVARERNQHF